MRVRIVRERGCSGADADIDVRAVVIVKWELSISSSKTFFSESHLLYLLFPLVITAATPASLLGSPLWSARSNQITEFDTQRGVSGDPP